MDLSVALLTIAVVTGCAARAWQMYCDFIRLGVGGFSHRYCLLSAVSYGCLGVLGWRLNAELAMAASILSALFYLSISVENGRSWLHLRARPRKR